jgi:uncharacterized protein (DUF934 family)
MKLIAANQIDTSGEAQNGAENTVTLANDADPRTLDLTRVARVDLQFPKFTDGRAFSQAFSAAPPPGVPR